MTGIHRKFRPFSTKYSPDYGSRYNIYMSESHTLPGVLFPLSRGIWTATGPYGIPGIEFGCRMTVIRLSTGALVLHSPVRLSNALKDEINNLGEVKFLVAPNRFHHLRIKDYAALYPGARIWGAPGLPEKRPDIKFDRVFDDESLINPEGEIRHFLFRGVPALNEVVFYHPDSKTLILTDLIFNYSGDTSFGTKLFTRMLGVYGEPRVSRLIRYIFLKDREQARESARRILSLDFDRVVLSHRDIIETGGKEIVSSAFECFGY